MKIGFDSYFLGPASRGMGRFAQLLSKKLDDVVLLSGEGNLRGGSAKLFPVWEQFFLPKAAARAKVDCVISPYNTAPVWLPSGVKRVVVVHDLIYMGEPWLVSEGSFLQGIGRIYRKLVVPMAVRKADLIVTVSEYSKNQISEYFGIRSSSIFVLPNSFDSKFAEARSNARDANLIFTVAGEARSKNLKFLLDVFEKLRRVKPELRLVVAGVSSRGKDSFEHQISQLSLGDSVVILPRVSDDTLAELYSTCGIFVCASLMEGFGIPLLEAMSAGAPICASNTTSLPEVCGDAAYYFSPTDEDEAAAAIASVLKNGVGIEKQKSAAARCENYSESRFSLRCKQLQLRLIELCGE